MNKPMSPRKTNPPTIEFVLLGLIRQRAVHGYDLLQTLKEDVGIGMVWHIKPGRLYALLDKLEQLGWLQSTVKPGDGFMPRKEYSLAEPGQQALQEWMNTPVKSPHRMRQEFLARLYFADKEGRQVVLQLIDLQQTRCEAWLLEVRAESSQRLTGGKYEDLVTQFRVGQIQAMLTWLESCRKRYSSQQTERNRHE